MNNRRTFFKNLAGLSAAFSFQTLSNKIIARDVQDSLEELQFLDLPQAVANEELWIRIQQAYTSSPNIIDLNSGGVSPQPKVVQEAAHRYTQMANEAPSYYMWRILQKSRENIRNQLAQLGGCDIDEIAFTRNTTESINTVMLGLNWSSEDEVVLAKQDYSTVKKGWEQLSKRYGVKLNWVDLNLPVESEKEIVDAYIGAMTAQTKVINITQVINWNGQVLPTATIRKICDAAGKRGIFTIVDGAHAFGQLDFKIPDLGCDAFGASLHKWLCAPFGTGILYIRKDKISKVWPLYPSEDPKSENIRKFEHIGTYSVPNEQAIGHAIDFHNSIGTKLKQERLRYLRDYWCKRLEGLDGVKFHHPLKAKFSCAIGLFSIEGVDRQDVINILWAKYRIHVTNTIIGDLKGIRISPNVFTSTKNLDRLVEAIYYICGKYLTEKGD